MSSGDLWSFIKNSKATESASFKVLQKFILSLNKHELRHLIETYLKSKLPKAEHDKKVSYTYTTQNRLFNSNNNATLNAIDEQILSKLNHKYGNKYNKKIVKKIQQNKNLLSIHPQVLAYSFQYLSYKQLCKIQHTCIYFTYLNKQYPALTHYYLEFDRKLFINVVKNKANLNFLSNYKHIHLNYVYNDSDRYWEKTKAIHSQMFKHILKRIICQSLSTLHTLQITPYVWKISDRAVTEAATFNLLLYIMNRFSHLPITNLIWSKDIFKPSKYINVQRIIMQIQSKIITKFPQLKHFEFGINYLPGFLRPNVTTPPVTTLMKSILVPVINNYSQLQSLVINCDRWNVLHSQHKLIPLIATKMKHLKTLSIKSVVTHEVTNVDNTVHPHCLSVEELNVMLRSCSEELFYTGPAFNDAKASQQILNKLFSCFISIKTFTFDGYSAYASDKAEIDWLSVFNTLFRNKRIYSNNNQSILALQSLMFKRISYGHSVNILKSLINSKHETGFDLKKLDIEIKFPFLEMIGAIEIQTLFNRFVDDHFIPFVKNVDDNFKLSTINVSFSRNKNISIIQDGYFEPVLKLLDNIPKSLRSFKLSIPLPYRPAAGSHGKLKIKEIESMKVAQKLSLISATKTRETKLESITLENVQFSPKSKKFLLFYFGYNNKLIIEDDKYYFKFV